MVQVVTVGGSKNREKKGRRLTQEVSREEQANASVLFYSDSQ